MSVVLVTGANGFVGRALVPRLLADGHKVVRIVRNLDQVDSVGVGDIAEYKGWTPILAGVNVVVHLAARAHVTNERVQDPLAEFRRVNTVATLRLAREAAAAGVRRFVFLSSIGVNGARTKDHPFVESDEPEPAEPYAISKWEAERELVEIGAESQMGIARVRAPLIVGPGAKGNLRRLVSLVNSGLPLPFGAICNRRTLVALDDLCELLSLGATHRRAAGGLFFGADDDDLSTPQLLRDIATGLGRAPRVISVPLPTLRVAAGMLGLSAELERMTSSLRVKASRARDVLGWRPTGGVRRAIRLMTAEYQRVK